MTALCILERDPRLADSRLGAYPFALVLLLLGTDCT